MLLKFLSLPSCIFLYLLHHYSQSPECLHVCDHKMVVRGRSNPISLYTRGERRGVGGQECKDDYRLLMLNVTIALTTFVMGTPPIIRQGQLQLIALKWCHNNVNGRNDFT